MIEYKCGWEREIERCKRMNLPVPEPLPHPDDIVIDMRTGEVLIRGPMTKEEQADLARMADRLKGFNDEIAYLERRLKREKDPAQRKEIEDDTARDRRTTELIASAIAGQTRREEP